MYRKIKNKRICKTPYFSCTCKILMFALFLVKGEEWLESAKLFPMHRASTQMQLRPVDLDKAAAPLTILLSENKPLNYGDAKNPRLGGV